MYKSLFPVNTHDVPEAIDMRDEKWYPYLTLCRKSCIGDYDMIADRVATTNNPSFLIQKTIRPSDQAWTQSGSQAKSDREDQMQSAAIFIQSFWRRKYDPHHMLYQRALKITSKKYLEYLSSKQYSLALRNACKNVQTKLVELLIHYRKALQININEPSSNDHTALDWANTIMDNQKKMEIVKLLTQAGAVSGLTSPRHHI